MKRSHFISGWTREDSRRVIFAALWIGWVSAALAAAESPEYFEIHRDPGRLGGRMVVALRAEPTTFNPLYAGDMATRTIAERLTADLVHLNHVTHESEPGLAKSWTVSPDGRRFTLELRRGIRFSDGHPFDADDVVFSFQVHLDEKVASRFRAQLFVGGQPVRVHKLGSHRVEFEVAQPYAVGVKMFDSITILPEHRLAEAYREGRLPTIWGLSTSGEEIVGLGPFRLKRYLKGERLELERNPHYWKLDRTGQRLPYLDEIVVLFVPSKSAQVLRFQSGELDVIERLDAASFHLLERANRGSYDLHDLGAGFAFHFLFFNLNDIDAEELPVIARKQSWFHDARFRRAVSLAIDREGIIRLVYQRRATALASPVTPGNKLWVNTALESPRRSLPEARRLLSEAGYSWNSEGRLIDSRGERVFFTLVTNSSNEERVAMSTVIQQDLRELGIEVRAVPIEHSSLVDRVLHSFDYEAAILGLTDGVDPVEAMNVWLSDGDRRLWRVKRSRGEPAWQEEVDRLMQEQVTEVDPGKRKHLYDRVQAILAENQPCILLVSPNVLVGAKRRLGHFAPTVFEHVTLWNADELYWQEEGGSGGRH